jgi:hypothetical protein
MRWAQMLLAAGGLTAGTWYAAAHARKLLASSSSSAIAEPASSGCVLRVSQAKGKPAA